MREILAFLQIIQILGRWLQAAVVNFHITSAVIIFIDILNRLVSEQSIPLRWWELIPSLYLLIYFKYFYQRKEKIEVSVPLINIENKNAVEIRNSIEILDIEKTEGNRPG